ncbi:hypothetical protein FPSE5266_11478 [Fusarium pseudograminearum]|nr:hypothetical protein FPSE5266_11478 [Fusarium pseudograminearum]
MAIPHRIVIVGSGVFGLSTAYYMSLDQKLSNSQIILLDAWNFEPDSRSTSVQNPGAANSDTSRIVRRAYPKGPYAALAYESVERWRTDWGADGRYVEQRLLFSGEGGPLEAPKKKGETVNYVKDAYATGCEMTPGGAGALEIWNSLDEIRSELQASKHENASSDKTEESSLRGFVSKDCGYANSGATIEWLRQKIIRMGRVDLRVGQVEKLVYSSGGARIDGVVLVDGTEIHADLTVIAAGCHSSRLLQLPSMCTVESAFVAYIQLTESEAQELRKRQWPLIVNTHRGVFCVGPDQDNCLKLGQCSTGSRVEILKSAHLMDRDEAARLRSEADSSVQPDWANPGTGWGGKVTLTKTGEVVDDDPESAAVNKALAAFRGFLLELLGPQDDFASLDVSGRHDPLLNSIAVRPFARVRRCWYNDTPSYDFIVDYHPSFAVAFKSTQQQIDYSMATGPRPKDATAAEPLLAPAWVNPDLGRLMVVHKDVITPATDGNSSDSDSTSTSTKSYYKSWAESLVDLPAGAIFARINGVTPTSKRDYDTVQSGISSHFIWNSDLYYCNHSCSPTLECDTSTWEVRVSRDRPLRKGDVLSVFYPSTEWIMAHLRLTFAGLECHFEVSMVGRCSRGRRRPARNSDRASISGASNTAGEGGSRGPNVTTDRSHDMEPSISNMTGRHPRSHALSMGNTVDTTDVGASPADADLLPFIDWGLFSENDHLGMAAEDGNSIDMLSDLGHFNTDDTLWSNVDNLDMPSPFETSAPGLSMASAFPTAALPTPPASAAGRTKRPTNPYSSFGGVPASVSSNLMSQLRQPQSKGSGDTTTAASRPGIGVFVKVISTLEAELGNLPPSIDRTMHVVNTSTKSNLTMEGM